MFKLYFKVNGAVFGFILWPTEVIATEMESTARGEYLHVYERGATVSTISLEDIMLRDIFRDD